LKNKCNKNNQFIAGSARILACYVAKSGVKALLDQGFDCHHCFRAFALSTQGCVRSQQRVDFLSADLFFNEHNRLKIKIA